MLIGTSFPKTTQQIIHILLQIFVKLILNQSFKKFLIIRAKHLPVNDFPYPLVHFSYELALYFQLSVYQEMIPLKENHLWNLLI